MYTLINENCLDYCNNHHQKFVTCFCDPPDNIGLIYKSYQDKLSNEQYIELLDKWLHAFINIANTVWFSYNAKWTFEIGCIVSKMLKNISELEAKLCVQTFTFGQHNHYDLGNNYRPLLRLRWKSAPLLPDTIRVPSWRQKHGDKRANPRGRVPGDVFDFPRVTGNSKQRRSWHPTQLNEELVERCIRLTTPKNKTVLDPFAGTGTTLRVCKKLENPCTLIEIDKDYCYQIAKEHNMQKIGSKMWKIN